MTDYQKCKKLMKYNRQVKKMKSLWLVFTLFGLAELACALISLTDEATINGNSVLLLSLSVYFLYIKEFFMLDAFESYFYTKMLLHTPLRKYALTKFIPTKYFIRSLPTCLILLTAGIIGNIFKIAAGEFIINAMINGAIFIGIIFAFAPAVNKIPILFVPYTAISLIYLFAASDIFTLPTMALSLFDGLNGIAGLIIAFILSVLINLLSSLLSYLINTLLYKLAYPKFLLEYYQKVMTYNIK